MANDVPIMAFLSPLDPFLGGGFVSGLAVAAAAAAEAVESDDAPLTLPRRGPINPFCRADGR